MKGATSANILDDCKVGVFQTDGGLARAIERRLPLSWRLSWAYYQTSRLCEPPTAPMNEKAAEAVRAVKEDGIYIDETFMDRDEALALGGRMRGHLDSVLEGKFERDNPVYAPPGAGTVRINKAETLDPACQAFFDDPFICNVATSASCGNPRKVLRVDLRRGPSRHSEDDTLHFDDYPWGHRIKAFLYLSDTSEDDSPFVYAKGTHKRGPWRDHKELESIKWGHVGSWGHYLNMELLYLKQTYGLEETVVTGKAGTLLIANTIGLHRGTPPTETGERVSLTTTFWQTWRGSRVR